MSSRLNPWIGLLGVVAGLMLLVAIMLVAKATDYKPETAKEEIARFDVFLNNVTLEDIKKGNKSTIYYGNDIKITNNDLEGFLEKVEIGGRGNSTWDQVKKPFKLKLDGRKNLLDLGKSKKWILLANNFDDTHLRNEIAFEFWNMMNDKLIMKEAPVELYFDGEYEGLYYLTRKIEISKSMVDLRNLEGAIVELDNINSEEQLCYYTEMGNCLTVTDLVAEQNKEAVMEMVLKKFNDFEKAAQGGDWDELNDICDIDSMVKYFLISEFSANPDAYTSSLFFYVDGEQDKIHVGPAWDFDFAFANQRWIWGNGASNSPERSLPMKKEAFGFNVYDAMEGQKQIEPNMNISRMFYWMIDIPEFREAVSEEVGRVLMGRRKDLMNRIIEKAKIIRDAANRNNEKWERNEYDEEVERLLWWVFKRYDYIEREYGWQDSMTTYYE